MIQHKSKFNPLNLASSLLVFYLGVSTGALAGIQITGGQEAFRVHSQNCLDPQSGSQIIQELKKSINLSDDQAAELSYNLKYTQPLQGPCPALLVDWVELFLTYDLSPSLRNKLLGVTE